MVRHTLLLAPALWLAACATMPPIVPEGPALMGQTVRVNGPTVRPVKVVEDSRCPADVRCVWAGRVVILAEVAGGNWRRTVKLTLGDEGVTVANGRLRLVSVTPEKLRKSDPAFPYRFSFAFQGGL